MKKPKLSQKDRGFHISSLMDYLKREMDDLRFLNHDSFKSFTMIHFKDVFNTETILAVPTRVEMHTHGLMGISSEPFVTYYKSMRNFATICNVEIDLEEKKWTEKTLKIILKNPPPHWFKNAMSEKMKKKIEKANV